jgi:hypothetical protein
MSRYDDDPVEVADMRRRARNRYLDQLAHSAEDDAEEARLLRYMRATVEFHCDLCGAQVSSPGERCPTCRGGIPRGVDRIIRALDGDL